MKRGRRSFQGHPGAAADIAVRDGGLESYAGKLRGVLPEGALRFGGRLRSADGPGHVGAGRRGSPLGDRCLGREGDDAENLGNLG